MTIQSFFYNFVTFYSTNIASMKKALYYVGYVLSYGIWYLMSLLPLRVLYILSDLLYIIMAHVVKYRHRVIWKNLSTSFPEKDKQALRNIEKGFYHWFCDYLVETLKLMTMSDTQLKKRMKFTGMEQFTEAINSKQSCAVYLGHYCNWEWITSMPYWLPQEVQCCQLYHPLENKYFDLLFKQVRERNHAVCIPMQESLRKILELKRNNTALVVGYIADQAPLWWNIHHWVDFLHHDTPVLTGAERIIKHTDQACFYGDIKRIKRGYYECEMKRITLHPKQHPDWQLTDSYHRMLEETIRRQPELYLWSHNRWKRTREEFDRNWEVIDGKVMRKKNQ